MMLPIIAGDDVKKLDDFHMQSEGISSVQLMERAGKSFVAWYEDQSFSSVIKIYVFVGSGNNGGDGLVIARLLQNDQRAIHVVCMEPIENCSEDFIFNFSRLPDSVEVVQYTDWPKEIKDDSVIVDAVLGVGVNRPLNKNYAELISFLNTLSAIKLAVDLPSGLPADHTSVGLVFQADFTLTFQFPKLSLLFPEHAEIIGKLVVLDIGISESSIHRFSQNRFYLREIDIKKHHKYFHRFSHKGDFGKVLLIGGALGKTGAINLAGHAALRTGSGLVLLAPQIPDPYKFRPIVPELMVFGEKGGFCFEEFDSVAIGPGMGLDVNFSWFRGLLDQVNLPIVLDADGINLLSKFPELIDQLPVNSILTPHFKEFERLVGKSSDHLERIQRATDFATKYNIILILKGAHTLIAMPDGRQIFNSSGNQYMATAGSGDVLTGMIASFLGQKYSPENAAICGVFHHGMAGEIASQSKYRGMIASDIINAIPETFVQLEVL
nr:NAD(P)H-hydrate dehydratase [Belliella filtrata]